MRKSPVTQGRLNCGMIVLARAILGHGDIGTEGDLSPATLLLVCHPGRSRMRVYDGSSALVLPSAPWPFMC